MSSVNSNQFVHARTTQRVYYIGTTDNDGIVESIREVPDDVCYIPSGMIVRKRPNELLLGHSQEIAEKPIRKAANAGKYDFSTF